MRRSGEARARGPSPSAESAAFCRRLDDPTGLGLAIAAEFHVAAMAGDLARAEAVLAEAESHFRRAGAPWGLAYLLHMRAETAQIQGDSPRSVRWLRESIALAGRIDDIIMLSFGLTNLAGALVEHGDLIPAARLHGAVEALRERSGTLLQSPVSEALAERQLAALRDRLDPDVLATAWAAGKALSTAQAVAEADALATALSTAGATGDTGPERALPGGLSAREADVLRLAATGLTNARIADRLFLSEHTVRAHLQRIYQKLDVHTRSEATRFALEHGLA